MSDIAPFTSSLRDTLRERHLNTRHSSTAWPGECLVALIVRRAVHR